MDTARIEQQLISIDPNAAQRLAALLDWAMQYADSAIDAAGVENIVLVSQGLYDKYIAPIDVPWIPDPAEPVVVDFPARWFIGQVIRGFHQFVHREPQVAPIPVVPPTPPAWAAP